jgi:uncharacterized protein (TIGR01777 family)
MTVARDKPRIILPGGAGFLGRHLCSYFSGLGYEVIVLSRRLSKIGFQTLAWDGKTVGPWATAIDGADAVVNLAGRSVNCRYTARNRREIYDSRLESTRAIGQAIAAAKSPPRVWINSSSATIYRDARDREMDEATGEIGSGFSVDVCRKWEAALADAPTPRTRKVAIRSAMVFGPGHDGVFEAFARIVRAGLGGTMGDGGQFVSWVHVLDFCRAVQWIIEHDDLAGAINIASPNPLPNREFMRIFRKVCNKRIGVPSPRWLLEIGAFFMRTETELLLKSRRVVPGRLIDSGVKFEFPRLLPALRDVLSHG